jgi:hypothetical protein
LQGAVGELPPGGLVRVRVAPERAAEAREIIADWEKAQPADAPAVVRRKTSWAPYAFLLGGALGFFAGWLQYNSPASSNGIDYDDDGILEERYFYAGQKQTGTEQDRNSDGHADVRFEYDSHGVATDSWYDDNFDRRFESHTELRRGQPHVMSTDLDGDGFSEEVVRFQNGVATEWDFVSPSSRAVVKREYYRAGRLFAADFDADADGKFERRVEYDALGEPKP